MLEVCAFKNVTEKKASILLADNFVSNKDSNTPVAWIEQRRRHLRLSHGKMDSHSRGSALYHKSISSG